MDSKSPLKVLILGGSGRTGKETVKLALKKGWKVRSVTRNLSKVPKFEEGEVEWIEGSVTDPEIVKKAVKDQDAIISTIGPDGLGKTTLYSDSAKIIIDAMNEAKIKRLLIVSSERESPAINWLGKNFMKLVLGELMKDVARMEEIFSGLQNSEIEWTIVRPFRLFDKKFTGKYRVGPGDLKPTFGAKTRRPDLADFLVKELTEKNWVKKFVTIGK